MLFVYVPCSFQDLNIEPAAKLPFFSDIFKCIFLNENVLISLQISMEFVPKVRVSNIRAFIQIMAWHRPGDKPLSEPMIVDLPTLIYLTLPRWVNLYRTEALTEPIRAPYVLHGSIGSHVRVMSCLVIWLAMGQLWNWDHATNCWY